MTEAVEKVLLDKDVLREYFTELLTRRGIDQRDAEATIDVLLSADLRGIDSHGVLRLAVYLKRLDLGLMAKENNIKIEADSENFVVIDGGNYLGPVAAKLAMEKAIEKAQSRTIGLALVRNNHHYGACCYYTMMSAERDMLGFTTTNTVALMAPTGGKRRVIGNNPFSFAAPAGKYKPFVLDIAMSNVAAGKILLARKNGKPIPLGWALNKEGEPTQDAYEGFEGGGMLLPVGGHKGYGMAVMLDILSGVLTGSAFGTQVKALQDYETKDPIGTGHMMAALNIDHIIGIDTFKRRMDQLIEEIKGCDRAKGVEEIFIPGEIEYRTFEKRSIEGVPISKAVIEDINKLGAEVGMGRIM